MTYKERVQRVVDKLNDSGYDSEQEWAESILRAIGITEKFPNGKQSFEEQPVVQEETAPPKPDDGSFSGFIDD